jgi:hypothetical protein
VALLPVRNAPPHEEARFGILLPEDEIMKAPVSNSFVVATLLFSLLVPASGQQASSAPADAPRYVPGFGDFMLSVQARHAKLWFAGSAQNWDLADYLIDELKEGLEDATKYVPMLKDLPVGQMIGSTMDGPVGEMEQAIKAKDRTRFVTAYDKLTEACNACHQAASRPFIVVQRPLTSPYPNQSFAPPKK